ncbi:hypothetical protein D3C73_1221900 [compost metagenome]
MWAFCIIRSEVFPWIFSKVTPSAVRSTRNDLTCPSATSRAKTHSTSAVEAPPIHRFAPSKTQVPPSRFASNRAVVESPPAMSEPCSGSVNEKTPLKEKSMTLGIHSFC